MLEVDAERPLHPLTLAMLWHVREATRQMDAQFVVAGATARDILLWHVYGVRPDRATRDVDVAVCAVSWEAHADLVKLLEATGLFTLSVRVEHTLTFLDKTIDTKSMPLDLVPFGPIEAPAGTITWPKDKGEMNVLGFREAIDSALQIHVGDGLQLPVVSLPALVLLKLLAWQDRRTTKNTDASDLFLVMRNYYDAGNNERIWDVAADLVDAHSFDLEIAAAALLGRDARRIALPATCDAVIKLLEREQTYKTLLGDMLARAAAQYFDGFVDGTTNTLEAFRNGFLRFPDGPA